MYLDKIVGRVVSFHGAVISAVQELPSPDTVLNETLYLFFQRSSQPSDAWNLLILIFSVSSLAFIFGIDADTTTFLLVTVKSHLKLRSSKLANSPCLSLLRFHLFPCVFIDLKFYSLFLIQVDSVFFWMPYFIATWNFDDPSSTSFKAAYLSLIDFVLKFPLCRDNGHCKVHAVKFIVR